MKDAYKVIHGMFNISIIEYLCFNPKEILSKTYEYRELVGKYNILGTKDLILILCISIIIIFFKSNSIIKMKNFKANCYQIAEIIFYFSFGILSLGKMATFLYFNF